MFEAWDGGLRLVGESIGDVVFGGCSCSSGPEMESRVGTREFSNEREVEEVFIAACKVLHSNRSSFLATAFYFSVRISFLLESWMSST